MFCPQCGKEVSDGQVFCPSCGSRTAGAAGPEAGGRARTPWEDREREGFFGGLAATIKRSLFGPGEFFRKMNITGGLSDPLLYAMITAVTGIMVSYVWQVLFQDSFRAYLPADGTSAPLPGLHGPGLAVAGMFIPFLVIIGTFLSAGMLHLLLLMVRGGGGGFEATFRVVSYSCGTFLFMTIPFCGGMIAFVWNIIVSIIGLKETHGTTGGKASFAVLFPYLLCCAAVALMMVVVFGTIAASLGAMKPAPWK
jgi:hypothetical protein